MNWELSEDKEGHKIEKLNNFPRLTVRKLSFNSSRNSVKKEIKRDYGNEYSLSIFDYCMDVKESSFIWKINFEDFVNEGIGKCFNWKSGILLMFWEMAGLVAGYLDHYVWMQPVVWPKIFERWVFKFLKENCIFSQKFWAFAVEGTTTPIVLFTRLNTASTFKL